MSNTEYEKKESFKQGDYIVQNVDSQILRVNTEGESLLQLQNIY